MSISNDHFYSHVNRYIVEKDVTWLECAACCTVWSTMLVYYLEAPFGNLIDVPLGKAQGRTQVKGNLFSFSMPWEDIEKCCRQASRHASRTGPTNMKMLQEELGLPHSEEILAMLVNVHIVGGSKDLALHLKGLTLRIDVLEELTKIMRETGYPGYDMDGVNSESMVGARLRERYKQKYPDKCGTVRFIPRAVEEAVRHLKRAKESIVQNKVATPPEAPKSTQEWERTSRPHHIVPERSSRSQANIHENYKQIFSKFGDLEMTTGTEMTDQFNAWYLGMAFPYTLPCAVGGYDVPTKSRWRRPEDRDLPTHENRESLREMWRPLPSRSAQKKLPSMCSIVGPACAVKLRDLVRGLPQRIEGQFRRHWGFTPALWNLFFRESVNLGVSLSVKTDSQDGKSGKVIDTDAAIAAADLFEKLGKGKYIDPKGKVCRINNDASKLPFAVNLSNLQRRLLADFRFRCGAIPGTQEIRTKIGHLGRWACVNYGNGIFCTISPGERHNYPPGLRTLPPAPLSENGLWKS